MPNDIDTNVVDNQEPNIIDDLTGYQRQAPNGASLEVDGIDALFGNGATNDDGMKAPAGETTTSSTSKEKPKMTPDEYMKELQSRVDKTTHTLKTLEAQNRELAGAADFVNQLYEDPDVFNAFIAEINPALVKPRNPEDYIRDSLSKEFGPDFVPDEREENIRGSRTWLYNKRADDLYGEAITKSNKVPETISQLKERRMKERKQMEIQASQEKQAIVSEFNWGESDYTGFLNWANKVSTMDFAKLYQYGKTKKGQQTKSPNLVSTPGGTPQSDSAYMTELNNFFGK